jgi:hypothetical protein
MVPELPPSPRSRQRLGHDSNRHHAACRERGVLRSFGRATERSPCARLHGQDRRRAAAVTNQIRRDRAHVMAMELEAELLVERLEIARARRARKAAKARERRAPPPPFARGPFQLPADGLLITFLSHWTGACSMPSMSLRATIAGSPTRRMTLRRWESSSMQQRSSFYGSPPRPAGNGG